MYKYVMYVYTILDITFNSINALSQKNVFTQCLGLSFDIRSFIFSINYFDECLV